MFWEISGKKFKNYGGLAEPNLMTKFLIRQFINNYFINFEICEFSPYWPPIFFSDLKSISIIIFGLFLSVKFLKISKFKNTVSYPFYSMSRRHFLQLFHVGTEWKDHEIMTKR